MKIVSVTRIPETTIHANAVEVVFSHGEAGLVTKRLMLSTLMRHGEQACEWNYLFLMKAREARNYLFLMKAREAERDFALRIFGDDWRKHVGKMWGEPQPHEMRLVEQFQKAMQ